MPLNLSRGLPRILVAGVLWVTLVLTAAQLFLLSHIGFVVLGYFTQTREEQQRQQQQEELQRLEDQDHRRQLQQQQRQRLHQRQHGLGQEQQSLQPPPPPFLLPQQQQQQPSRQQQQQQQPRPPPQSFFSPSFFFSPRAGSTLRLNTDNFLPLATNATLNTSSLSSSSPLERLQSSSQASTYNLATMNQQQQQQQQQSKRSISKDEWTAKLDEIVIEREDLNKLIMNYLIIEGYKDAAEKFSQESGATPPVNLESIQDRMVVRTAIQRGHIEEAIERVNDLDPVILDTNPKLFFHLQQQRLIEYIREGRIMEALEFAQEELAPRGEENPEFLSELERTMSLLAFELNGPSPVSDLLTPAQRQKLASELNSALLLSQSQEKDPKLPNLLKMLWWAQQQLDDRVAYPKITDFAKAELVMSSKTNGNNGTGPSTM